MEKSVTVNGMPCTVVAGTLTDFMAHRGYDSGKRGVAVALNGQVVPRSGWESTELRDGDRLEIVEPVQGG